jgi:hypothetical protein
MPQRVKIRAILREARRIRSVWEENPDFCMGEVDLTTFIHICDTAEALAREYSAKTIELKGLLARRDDKTNEVSNLITRFRSGMKGWFGADSPQYEQAGGTRRSNWKPPKRRAKSKT